MQLWIDVESSAGVKQGSGPITSATSWRNTRRLDKAGEFSFTMAAGDPMAAEVQHKRVVRCYGVLGEIEAGAGVITELGAGIVDQIEVTADDPPMLRVSGSDLLRELTYRTVGDLEISSQAGVNADYVGAIIDDVVGEFALPQTINITLYDYVYVGHSSPFSKLHFDLGAQKNNNATTLSYQYYSGSSAGWDSLAGVVDDTVVAGAWLAQSGDLHFTKPVDWDTTLHDGHTLYWVRIHVDAGSDLDPVDVNSVAASVSTTSATALADILALAPAGWAYDLVSGYGTTTNAIYMQFAGESVLEALCKVAEKTGEHFRLGTGRAVTWLRKDNPASGLRAISTANPIAAESNDEVCLLTDFRRTGDSYELVNGVYCYGSGSGDGRLTIAQTTEAEAGYTVNAGTNYISHAASQATYGQIDRQQTWSDIAPAADTVADTLVAANTLARTAIEWLAERIAPQYAYSCSVVKANLALLPGQTIQVVYHRWIAGYHAINVDATLYILEATTEVSQEGVRTVGLTLATVKRWARTEADLLVDAVRGGRDTRGHGQQVHANDVRSVQAGEGQVLTADGLGRSVWRYPQTMGDGVTVIIAGNYIPKSALSGKGSLVGATAAGTPADVPVGADSKFLMADHTQANGVTWADAAGHDAVTLAASADVLLGLSTQELSLDTQVANRVLAGPTTGADAAPTFRSLVFADVPSSSNPGAAASVLASDASGYLRLVRLGLGVAPSYPLHVAGVAFLSDRAYVGSTYVDPGANCLAVEGNLLIGNTTDGFLLRRYLTIGELIGIDTGLAAYNDLNIRAHSSSQLYLYTSGGIGIGTGPPADPGQDNVRVGNGLYVGGDTGGIASTIGIVNSTQGVGAGAGSVLMNGATARSSTGWLKIYVGTAARYVPFWTTVTG